MILLDSNILVRYLLQDIPDHAERSSELIARASRGEVQLFIPATAVAEITWLLIKQKRVPASDVASALSILLNMQAVTAENQEVVLEGLRTMTEIRGLSFVDCYHLALAKSLGMTQVYSFDKKMDRYSGVERIEP